MAGARLLAIFLAVSIAIGSVTYLALAGDFTKSVNAANDTINVNTDFAGCSTDYASGAPSGTPIYLNQGSTVQLCVKYFYYNSTAGDVFSPLGTLFIIGFKSIANSNASKIYDADSLFSISASTGTSQVNIGGSQNSSEGTLVTYTISAKPSTLNGAYFLGFSAAMYPQLENCGATLQLLLGNVQYAQAGGNCVPLADPSGSSQYQLNSSGFINGILFEEVVGTSNSP
jgi:hypothetical protein